MKIAAFIPARSGSKRIPDKNLQTIMGVPLFLWAANNLNRVLSKDEIFIDSDSDEILDLARTHSFGALKRPADLATNATDGNRFMMWEVSNVDADLYIQHLPPMPFLKKATLDQALYKVLNRGFDSAVGVTKKHLYLWDDKGPLYDRMNIPNSFTLPETIIEGMGLYIVKKEAILANRTRFGVTPYLQVLDSFETVDIDYPEDLEFARTLAKGLGPDSVYTMGLSELYSYSKTIKLLVVDVDGTLTDGGMYFSTSGDEFKKFNTKDGLALARLVQSGTEVAFLSSGFRYEIIKLRAEMLGITRYNVGQSSKLDVMQQWITDLGLQMDEVAYIGDDINDLVLVDKVGVFAAPSDASSEVLEKCNIILNTPGGRGCVREFIDRYMGNQESS